MPLAQFRVYSLGDFKNYILNNNFLREITFIQNHHTWLPNYRSLVSNPGEMYWLESMRHSHIYERGWNDIGQHITTFPSGNVAICRPLHVTPAGIYGANRGAICIENFGNFDEGFDVMTEAHKNTIIQVNAILCRKFGLKPNLQQVVYHHWYDTKGKRFSEDQVDSGDVLRNKLQKTCPGTNFFCDPVNRIKGNTIKSATENFYPLITTAMGVVTENQPVSQQIIIRTVQASKLNVRAGTGLTYPVIRQFSKGSLVNVYETDGDWCKVSANAEEWASSKFLT